MNTQIFIQARMGSTRLPGKVLKKICGKTIIELTVERLKNVKEVSKIVLVTSVNKENNVLVEEAKKIGVDYFRGSEENILDRFYQASKEFKPDTIIRVTADCPLIDPDIISKGLELFKTGRYDIVSNVVPRTYPHGYDFEIFSVQAMVRSWRDQRAKFKNEKVFDKTVINPTNYLFKNKNFRHGNIKNDLDLHKIRLTLDYKEDFEVIKIIYENLYKKSGPFNMDTLLDFIDNNSHILEISKDHKIF